jgi:putative transposase
LALDGSGKTVRNEKKDLAVFPTGKMYHADLNASYHIGARYFLREILKSFSEKERLQWEGKVPFLAARTRQALPSLISLHQAFHTEGVPLA